MSFEKIDLLEVRNVNLPHLLIHWKDGELQERCTVFIWALSGTGPQDMQAKILDGGETLRVRIPWPSFMQDAGKLTKNMYCKDLSKVVSIESTLKTLKGSADASVSSEFNLDLGMQVEEQFYNETVVAKHNQIKEEKGHKLLRYFRQITRTNGRTEKLPVLVAKYEMMGIRDNYRNFSTHDDDYDDVQDDEYEFVYKNQSFPSPLHHNPDHDDPEASPEPSPKKQRRQNRDSSSHTRRKKKSHSSSQRKRSVPSPMKDAPQPSPSLDERTKLAVDAANASLRATFESKMPALPPSKPGPFSDPLRYLGLAARKAATSAVSHVPTTIDDDWSMSSTSYNNQEEEEDPSL